MKRIERKWSTLAASLMMAVLVAFPALSRAQQTASIHGRATNPAGAPVSKGEVRLTQDRSSDEKSRKYLYTFPLDADGNFKGTGITPGTYLIVVFQEGRSLDFQENVNLAANDDKVVNFDMSRKEYLDKMTPEEKKQLEEYKKKNQEVSAANAKIANLNAVLTQARADTKAGNYDAAAKSMQDATAQKPDEAILWVALGDAQLGQADTAAKAVKASGKVPSSDPDVQQKYKDAAASYQKAVDANAAAKKPNVETAAAAYNQLGTAYARAGDGKGSSDAFEAAAKTDPTKAGMYYFNEAATLYNAGKLDEAGAAADKAIAAEPTRADAYYIKAQALIPKATVDPKTQKIVAPPGTIEAYQKFLELAPDNEQARVDEVKGILTGIGAQVQSSYKAKKK
ncbi:MAG TPA: tetratricopeptide repeat protein [Edaphobacter sp.]